MKQTDLNGLFTFDALVPLIKALSEEINFSLVVVTRLTDFIAGAPISTKEELGLEPNWYHFSELLEKCQNQNPTLVPIDPDDPAVIKFTGGTTGIPKGATLTNYNIVSAAHSVVLWSTELADNVSFDRRRVLCTLPYFHVYGQVCCVLYATYSTATQILLPKFDVDEVFDTMQKFDQINYFPCVPTMLTALLNHPRAAEIDWYRKFDYIVLGAAPSPSQLIEKAVKMDLTFHPVWGMSETVSLGICNPYTRPKLNGIGVPFIDVDIRLVDSDTLEDVEQGQPGEILVKAPYVMKGYWNNPEETAKVFTKDGWLRPGDVAYMDEDGYIFIVDRTKDIIIAAGYNIYPNEVDDVLIKHPKVKDAITVGIPDEYRGETVKSFVLKVDGVECTEEELIAYCREHLSAYKVPRFIEFRDELPRTAVGKAMRRILREEEIAKRQKK